MASIPDGMSLKSLREGMSLSVAWNKFEADRKAENTAKVDYGCPFHEDEFRAAVAHLNADPSRQKALEQAMHDRDTAKQDAEAQAQLNEIFGTQPSPAAENKPAFSAPSAENQTAAAPVVAAEKPAIDEDKTAAIDAQPEEAKPVEQRPAKKKMKLDL